VGPTQGRHHILYPSHPCNLPMPQVRAQQQVLHVRWGMPDQARSRNACLAFPGRSVPTWSTPLAAQETSSQPSSRLE